MADLVDQLSGYRSQDPVLDGAGEARPPTAEELDRPIVAPGTDAVLPCGIEYQAPWESPTDGLARHARAQVRALARAGLPVVLRRLTRPKLVIDDDEASLRAPHLTDGDRALVQARLDVGREVGYLRDLSIGQTLIAIRQMVISNSTALENVVAPAGARLAGFDLEVAVYKSTIVYTPWERDTVAPAIVEVLNRCAEVWVQGKWCVEVFRRAGVKNVFHIPVPYDPETNLACRISEPRGPGMVPYGKRFYAIGKWEPRKNYDALIGAFLTEFSPKERVSLFLKTNAYGPRWTNYPTPEESVVKWLNDPVVIEKGWTERQFNRAVRIVQTPMTEAEIVELHRTNNVYVTCSHGEGHDMPAFDARLAGNRLVYTGWSGAAEYAGYLDSRIWPDGTGPDEAMTQVHPDYGWEPTARWAMVSLPWIARALRVVAPPSRRIQDTDLYRLYGSQMVGAMMRGRIAKRFPEVYDKLVSAGGFG